MVDRRHLYRSVRNHAHLLWAFGESLLFPEFCLGCNQEGTTLCVPCADQRPPEPLQRCPFCQTLHAGGSTCRACLEDHALAGVFVLGSYHEWLWRDIIRTWKYQENQALQDFLLKLIQQVSLPQKIDFVLSIPMTTRRQRERGFNPADVLANALATDQRLQYASVLVRVKETEPQAKLGAEGRRSNVRGAFRCADPKKISGSTCLLVDDILTSGATLEEAARTLMHAGALKVYGVALARSDYKKS